MNSTFRISFPSEKKEGSSEYWWEEVEVEEEQAMIIRYILFYSALFYSALLYSILLTYHNYLHMLFDLQYFISLLPSPFTILDLPFLFYSNSFTSHSLFTLYSSHLLLKSVVSFNEVLYLVQIHPFSYLSLRFISPHLITSSHLISFTSSLFISHSL